MCGLLVIIGDQSKEGPVMAIGTTHLTKVSTLENGKWWFLEKLFPMQKNEDVELLKIIFERKLLELLLMQDCKMEDPFS